MLWSGQNFTFLLELSRDSFGFQLLPLVVLLSLFWDESALARIAKTPSVHMVDRDRRGKARKGSTAHAGVGKDSVSFLREYMHVSTTN